MNDSQHAADIQCPYPGLRPFYREESQFFFGREEHIDELLAKLESNRFVAVVGASGCGKSSLVRAGLLPMLENGFMAEAGPHWRMATLRPGNSPFEQLTQALLEESALGPERSESPQEKALLEATLRRGRFGLVEAMRETLLPEGTNLLVLVDQFEEIFRYREQSSVNEAEAFVDLMLAAAQHRRDPRQKRRDAPIYVLLTMRSDFIGDCSLFLGLPEAINASQFLTPRLNRDQCRAAIVGPARALGGEVEPPLVNHLLNNLRADADHLPLLQHVLMRMWRTAVIAKPDVPPTLSVTALEATGGMERALSTHADEAFQQLNPHQQRIAELMFRSLCEMGADGRATRRLIRLDDVATIAETTVDEVYPIVEVFRHPDRSFLMPPAGVPLKEDTVLDISHESLIRQWNRLTDWVADEAASARTYRRLRQTARLWKSGQAALWRTPDLEIAEGWREKQNPNTAWASRYGGELDLSSEFLDASVATRSRRQRIRKYRVIAAFATVMTVAAFMAFAALAANKQKIKAVAEGKRAEAEKVRAEKQTEYATEQEEIAKVEANRAKVEAERANRSSYNAGFTGILDQWRNQWRLITDEGEEEFEKRLDSFSEANREFTWYFCRSLTQQKEFEPQVIQTKQGAVNSLAYLGSAEQLLSGGENGEVRIWNMADANTPATPIWTPPQGKPILAVGSSPIARLVAFAADDGNVWVYDLQSHRVLKLLDHGGTRVRTLEFSPDGRLLATATDDNNILLWEMPSGRRLQTLVGHTNWVASVAFSPDGQAIASASYDTTIRVWDIGGDTPPIILSGHDAPVLSITFAPDGKRLASGSDDRMIKLWDLSAMKCRETVEGHAASVNAVAFSANGEMLVSGDDDGELRMWMVDDFIINEWVPPQRRHSSAINVIAFSPTGKTLATGSSDSTIVLWDANFGLRFDSERSECLVPTASAVTFSTGADAFASVSETGVVELWKPGADGRFAKDSTNAERLAKTVDATAVCFRPHSETMAIGTKDGSVGLWKPAGMIPSNPEDSHETSVLTLAFDPSGELLASADEQGWIYLWRIEDAGVQRVLTWKRHTGGVRSFAFAPEIAGQKTLASASEDGTVRIWNLDGMLSIEKEKLPQVIGDYEIVLDDHDDWVGAVAFSPERAILASAGDDGAIRLWEWGSWFITPLPERKHVLTGHLGAVTALSFSQDGKTLASGGVDKMVCLWDPLEGHMRLSLQGHLAAVRSVAFLSPSEASHPRALASFSEDGALKFWMAEASKNDSATKDHQRLTTSGR